MTIYIKKLLHISTLLLLTTSILIGQQAEKTLVKAFNLKGTQIVEMQLDGSIEVQTWNNNIMRIQLNIQLDNGSTAILKSLIKAGRYNLKGIEKNGDFIITAPGLGREVKIGGKALVDAVSYQVFVPKNVQVILPDEASTNTKNSKSAASM